MKLTTIIARLQPLWPLMERRYGVVKLSVFGSHARGTQKLKSDVDLLVSFAVSPTELEVLELRRIITRQLRHRVDVVPWTWIRDPLADGLTILADQVPVPRPGDNPAA